MRSNIRDGMNAPPEELRRNEQELLPESIDSDEVSADDIETGMHELDRMVANNDPEECARIQQDIFAQRELAKAVVRWQMGLE